MKVVRSDRERHNNTKVEGRWAGQQAPDFLLPRAPPPLPPTQLGSKKELTSALAIAGAAHAVLLVQAADAGLIATALARAFL